MCTLDIALQSVADKMVKEKGQRKNHILSSSCHVAYEYELQIIFT